MLISLADVKDRVSALCTGIIHIQIDEGKVYSYLNALATHVVTHILISLSNLRQLLSDVKEDCTSKVIPTK